MTLTERSDSLVENGMVGCLKVFSEGHKGRKTTKFDMNEYRSQMNNFYYWHFLPRDVPGPLKVFKSLPVASPEIGFTPAP